jgi:hypothetical protein
MATLDFFQLPINADEGLPQAFRLAVGDRLYQFRLYANVAEELLNAAPTGPIDLPIPGAFLVLRVDRESPTGLVTLLQRKLVLDHEYEAAELALTFRTMRLDPRNLNGFGAFGSQIVGGVARR